MWRYLNFKQIFSASISHLFQLFVQSVLGKFHKVSVGKQFFSVKTKIQTCYKTRKRMNKNSRAKFFMPVFLRDIIDQLRKANFKENNFIPSWRRDKFNSRLLKESGVFPIIAPHEIIAPPLWYNYHDCGGGGGGAIGYLITKLGGGL